MRLMVNFVYPPTYIGQGRGVIVVPAVVVVVDFATMENKQFIMEIDFFRNNKYVISPT